MTKCTQGDIVAAVEWIHRDYARLYGDTRVARSRLIAATCGLLGERYGCTAWYIAYQLKLMATTTATDGLRRWRRMSPAARDDWRHAVDQWLRSRGVDPWSHPRTGKLART